MFSVQNHTKGINVILNRKMLRVKHKPDSCASLLPNPIVYMNEKHKKNPTKLLNIPTFCVTIVKSSVV